MNAPLKISAGIGTGAYAIPEAARYIRIPPQRLRAWFTTDSKRTSVFQSDFGFLKGAPAISFLDLIDAQVAMQLRQLGLSLQRIRRVYRSMQTELQIRHPFCSNKIFTDGRDVFVRSAESVGDASFLEVLSLQHYFDEILAPFLNRIDYDEAAGLAQRWRIANRVVIDPRVSFGKPVIEGSRVSTFTIAREFATNNRDAEFVAILYGLSADQVLSALEFESEANQPKAA